MTEKTLKTLLRKKTLTPNDRVKLLHEAFRIQSRFANVLGVIQDSLHEEFLDLDARTRANDKRLHYLEDISDKLEDLIEVIDNIELPSSQEVR